VPGRYETIHFSIDAVWEATSGSAERIWWAESGLAEWAHV
jgi:hypothetical protein